MNFTKKLTLAASAILLTSTLAMAQNDQVPAPAITPILLEVDVEKIAKIVVADKTLKGGKVGGEGDGKLILAVDGEQTAYTLTSLLALGELAGTVQVTTNLNKWDVTLKAKYGGAMYQEGAETLIPGNGVDIADSWTYTDGHYLEAINSILNGLYGDTKARIEVSVCANKSDASVAETACTNATATRITQSFDGVTEDLEVSLARSMGKTSFGSSDTGTDNIVTFVIYVKVPFTLAELSGGGTYKERFDFILDAVY